MAGWTYFATFLAFLVQAVTGFGLDAAMRNAWLPSLFKRIVLLTGGDFAGRQWHHVARWFFLIFSVVHVNLVFYHGCAEGRGVIWSMAGGWKYVEKKKEKVG
jgi:Ni/Fe-hydrogenase 1 B-type cytochrome subunit